EPRGWLLRHSDEGRDHQESVSRGVRAWADEISGNALTPEGAMRGAHLVAIGEAVVRHAWCLERPPGVGVPQDADVGWVEWPARRRLGHLGDRLQDPSELDDGGEQLIVSA